MTSPQSNYLLAAAGRIERVKELTRQPYVAALCRSALSLIAKAMANEPKGDLRMQRPHGRD